MPALSSTPGVSRSWRNSTLMWMVCVYSRSYRLLSTCTTCSQADEQCDLRCNSCFKALRNFCCSSCNIHQLCTKYHLQLGQWTVWPVVTLASKSSVIFVALAATFISFLLEVESVFEVHDYIKSYLGETRDAHNFAKQFLERRQKLRPPSQHQVGAQSNCSFIACRNPPSLGFHVTRPIFAINDCSSCVDVYTRYISCRTNAHTVVS